MINITNKEIFEEAKKYIDPIFLTDNSSHSVFNPISNIYINNGVNAKLQKDMADAAVAIGELYTDLDDVATIVYDIGGDIGSLKVRLNGVERNISNTKGDVSNINRRLTNVENTLSDTEQNITNTNNRITQVERQYSTLEQKIDDTKQELEQNITNTKQELEQRINLRGREDADTEVSSTTIQNLNNRINRIRSDYENLNNRFESLQNKVEDDLFDLSKYVFLNFRDLMVKYAKIKKGVDENGIFIDFLLMNQDWFDEFND